MIEVIVVPYTGPVYRRSGNEIIVIGAGPIKTGITSIVKDKEMFGAERSYDPGQVARDKKIAQMRKQMSLAMLSRNKAEVTRLAKELTYLGQSW